MDLLATHHIAVYTPNFEAMEAFYTRTLGFPVTLRWDDAGIIFIDIGSTKLELIHKTQMAGTEPPHALDEGIGFNHVALHVPSTDAAYTELVKAGVKVLREPSNFKTVRIAFFSDPDGNVLELVEELG